MSKRQRRYSLFSFVFLVFSWETWNQRDEYCSIGRMEYTEFRTGIYLVEWKAPTDAKRKFRNGRSIMEEAIEDLQKLVIQYLAFYSNFLVWEVEWELVQTAKTFRIGSQKNHLYVQQTSGAVNSCLRGSQRPLSSLLMIS